jgi:hypothetical protein
VLEHQQATSITQVNKLLRTNNGKLQNKNVGHLCRGQASIIIIYQMASHERCPLTIGVISDFHSSRARPGSNKCNRDFLPTDARRDPSHNIAVYGHRDW